MSLKYQSLPHLYQLYKTAIVKMIKKVTLYNHNHEFITNQYLCPAPPQYPLEIPQPYSTLTILANLHLETFKCLVVDA